MVVTGGETVVAPSASGETVVAGGSSEEETGCRLVELDASSNIAKLLFYDYIAIISMQYVSIFQYAVPCTLRNFPLLIKPEGCNLLLLGFMARYNYHCDHVVQMWLLSSQPHPLIMQRELAGRVVRTNPTNILWIRPWI